MQTQQRIPSRASSLLLLLVLAVFSTTAVVDAETVLLAQCPKEPDVVGTFYNNGSKCVRDRQVLEREVIDATCPGEEGDYKYKNGYCRPHKKFGGRKRTVKPSCPEGYQRFGKQCQSTCPKPFQAKYGQCILPKATLATKYMTCPDPQRQHRYEAYCCSPEEGNCPKIECNVGNQVPGRFYYNTEEGRCERQPQTLARVATTKVRMQECPEGLVQVWGGCQRPCPDGYKSMKGKCDLRTCSFDATTDTQVRCPEGVYTITSALF